MDEKTIRPCVVQIHTIAIGKTRKAQRFLYNVRPQGTGAKEKENEHGADKEIPQSNGHRRGEDRPDH